jgi:Na+-transporting NADH:ubiquinone oxidoreductase subunit C
VLEVAGLYETDADIEQRFADIDARTVDLASGDYVESMDARDLDAVALSKDPELSIAIPAEFDVSGLRRRSIYAPVYIVRDGEAIEQVILPVYGAGLWSTMYGYLALEADGATVRGLRFYEHAETPGLGDQLEKTDLQHQVDGMSGATLTGRGVTNLIRYWVGPHGFGPYLAKLAEEAPRDD